MAVSSPWVGIACGSKRPHSSSPPQIPASNPEATIIFDTPVNLLRQLPRAVPLALAVLTLLPSAFGQAPQAQEPETPKPIHRAAPKPAAPATNFSLIVLDPAHGGSDDGAHLSNSLLEKDLNAAFADRLKETLTAKGFTVVITRTATTPAASDDDTPTTPSVPTEDHRAEQANHFHPVACLLLHATSAGHGVHLFTSSLTPLTIADESPAVLSWNEAQAATIPQSLRLATDLSTAFNSARIPLVLGRASVSPIDSLTCPAVTVEIAPLTNAPVGDNAYQTRIADAITNALVFWRGHLETEAARAAAAAAAASAKAPETPVKKPAPIKKPLPATSDEAPRKAAPIVRRPPETVPPATQPATPPPAGAR